MKFLRFVTLILGSGLVSAQTIEEGTKIPIDTSKLLKVKYGSAPWNTDSTQIDNAELFVRDKNSGKVLKILLEETEPDSSEFTGDFSVGFSKDKEVKPEVYIPPEKIRGRSGTERRFIEKIRANKIGRKPVVFKRDKEGNQLLDVFDTKEQARASFEAFKLKLESQSKKESLVKPVAKKEDIEAAAFAAKQVKLAELAAAAASREEQRIRQEQLEKQKAEERLRKQKAMAEAERLKKIEKAKELAAQALEKYRQGDFITAETLFKESIELDPSNTSYYFRYGVTLYRNEKYDDALVIMSIAKVDETTDVEKNYYMGLIHFRLKELDSSLKMFRKVKNSNHQIMAPSAAFYEGVILFGQEEYKAAKQPFEYVLDTSKDPKLDEKAEAYLEKIANALIFKRRQEMRHEASVTLGSSYDSNILFSPDNQTISSASDLGGTRALLMADYQYRMIYERTKEWSVDIDFIYYYSMKDEHAAADPTLANFKLPYVWKGIWGKRGYKLELSPGYETLLMDPDSAGTRSNILNSILFDTELTLIMKANWFAAYNIDVRQDDSQTADSIGENDADALQTTVGTTHTLFLDDTKKRAFITGGSYKLNAAKGDEKIYNRLQLNFTYSQPFITWKDASWNAGLTVYKMNYSKASSEREDTNYALNWAFNKIQKKYFNWGTSLTYTTNNSTSESNQYNKYEVLLTATFDLDEWYFRGHEN